MTVLELVTSPSDALAGLPDMRVLYEEALADYGPAPAPVMSAVMDTPQQRSDSAVAAHRAIVGPALHRQTTLGRVKEFLASPLPAEYREESRLSSRTITEDRSEAQQHAKRRDELGTRLVADFNSAAGQLNRWFDTGDLMPAGALSSASRGAPAVSTQALPKKGRPSWD